MFGVQWIGDMKSYGVHEEPPGGDGRWSVVM